MTYWLMLIGADSTCTRCTPLRGAGTGAGVAALSSSVAAFCTCSIALGAAGLPSSTIRRSRRAASGSCWTMALTCRRRL